MATINVDYPDLLRLFPEHLAPKRSESASFLIWYLENYYRLDPLDAVDAVCDQRGDKGVDGIYVNDNDKTITVFQSTISQSKDRTIGDKSLREFAGTLSQFRTRETIEALIASAPNNNVGALAKRLDLPTKVATYEVRGEFVTNIEIDGNGDAFLKTGQNIEFVGKSTLISTYISDTRDIPIHTPTSFDVIGFHLTEYAVDTNTKAAIAPIKATELVAMQGISDQSIFAYNVRGPLGRTQVNKDIVSSIRDQAKHKLFPLFHNGITIVAAQLEVAQERLSIRDYFVVNGCQSLTALYDNRAELTDNLRVLVKFIQTDPASQLAKSITEFSNNQNGVKPRDFMANNPMQVRLQNEFAKNYSGQYTFEIKRGEPQGIGEAISNETAGLLLMAFDLKEPWATHRKYQVFDDKYSDIFGRKEVTADRIVMCHAIAGIIDQAVPKLKNQLFARYVLTRYLLLYVIRNILEDDALWPELTAHPERFVRNPGDRDRFRNCIANIVSDLMVDVNAEVDQYGDDFDYRGKLRDSEWVKALTKEVVADHVKMVRRKKIQSFAEDWNTAQQDNKPVVVPVSAKD